VIVIVASYTSLTATTLENSNPRMKADEMEKIQQSIDQPFMPTSTRTSDNNNNNNNNKSEDRSENGNGSADEAGDDDGDDEESGDEEGDDESNGDDEESGDEEGDDEGDDEDDDDDEGDNKSENEVVKEDKSKDKDNSVAESPQTQQPIKIPPKEPTENNSKSADEDVDRSSGEPIPLTVPEEECVSFDHGDTSPTQNVTSIFNCGTVYKNCEWYFPGKFFHPCGIGKEFIPKINEMKELYNSKSLWLNGPPIVIPWASIDPPKMRKNAQFISTGWNKHNISMTHVHKTGGTSLVMAFSNVQGMGARGTRLTVYMPGKLPRAPTNAKQLKQKAAMSRDRDGGAKRSPYQSKSNIYGPGFQRASKFLDGAVKYRKRDEWGPTDHTLLAVVRDPADRFISAIGQATGAFGSSGNGVAKDLVTECVDGKETSKESLRCFIDLVKTNSTWTEVHFTPMAMEISFATIYKDIPVAVFPFQMVPSLMLELGSNPNMKKKDGHQKGYRKSDILTNMSIDDYDDDMMKSLCEIYKMDAVFFHHLGMENSCDPHLDYPTI